MPTAANTLIAYEVSSTEGWVIEPASGKRDWMDATPNKFAYRCLPLVMANQAGWVVRCPASFSCVWDGSPRLEGLKIRFHEEAGSPGRFISSHFGSGILTVSLPWLFRTPRGVGLWARGVTNTIKDGVIPLDGIVETDWAPYTFTMNWRLMRRNTEVHFKKGEPMIMLVPVALDLFEQLEPEFRHVDDNPILKEDFTYFVAKRSGNIDVLRAGGEGSWAMDYMRGHLPDGSVVTEHRKAFRLKEFPKK